MMTFVLCNFVPTSNYMLKLLTGGVLHTTHANTNVATSMNLKGKGFSL